MSKDGRGDILGQVNGDALRLTVQVLFVDLSAQGNPCFNILSCLECCLQGCYKCLGLNAMSATPHETVLIHFFFFFLLL